MDIFEQITRGHRKIKCLFKELENKKINQSEFLYRINFEIKTNILLEEKTLYSYMSPLFMNHSFLQEPLTEHKEILSQLNTLLFLPRTDTTFSKRLTYLKELIFKHFKKEEQEVFTISRTLLTKAQVNELSQSMKNIRFIKPKTLLAS